MNSPYCKKIQKSRSGNIRYGLTLERVKGIAPSSPLRKKGILVIEINPQEKYRVAAKAATQWSGLRGSNSLPPPWQGGALPDELNPQNWCFRVELNHRHGDFQSPALPTELQKHMATGMGLEPTTSSVTG